MEIAVFPRTFGIQPGMSPTAEGGQTPIMQVVVLDVGGTVVRLTFGLGDWQAFQRAVADPDEFAKEARAQAERAEARSKLVLAGSPVGPQPGRRTKQ